jgi:hypothetical protein
VNRIISLALVAVLGTALGCSGGVKDAQPKNANPNAVPRVHRATLNAGGGDQGGGGTGAKTSGAIKD